MLPKTEPMPVARFPEEGCGTPNLQRFAETWVALIAARKGLEIVPGSVRVQLKGGPA